jgi:hypothetical protein
LIDSGPNTNIEETSTTTYYVYSSALGGAKLMELGSDGAKRTGYVYVNGTRLAKQNIESTASRVVWHHPNAGSNSWIETGTGRIPDWQEMDPDKRRLAPTIRGLRRS